MLPSNYIDARLTKLIDFNEINDKSLLNENIETKIKKRKSKIFLIISNKRKQFMFNSLNSNLNLNNTANFIKIFNLIKSNEEKCNLINYLFTKNITNAKLILSKYEKTLNLNIDYNFLSTSNFILDAIEHNDEIIELIINKKENISYLVKIMNLMENENIEYDYNYIMITANLLIENNNIDKIIKKEIDHNKIIQLIIKHETVISYTYLFYIYAYLYFCDTKQVEKLEPLLDSLIWILSSKDTNNDITLLCEDVYDVLVIFSKEAKFSQKYFDNYDIIFSNGKFDNNDVLLEQKLSIISNLFKSLNSLKIKLFLQKDNGNLLNYIYNSLKLISDSCENILGNQVLGTNQEIMMNQFSEKLNLNVLALCAKILLTITFHKELTNLFLENKDYFNLIISIFSYIVSSKEIKSIYDETFNIILKIVNNIISNKHKLFISHIVSNNLHLSIKNKINYYLNCQFINEKIFISLMNIISALFDSQKKDKLKTQFVKLDLDNNKFNEIIFNVIINFGKNENINKKCNEFFDNYYPNESRDNFLQLSNFNFLDLNL
jgi:hypothetical protein